MALDEALLEAVSRDPISAYFRTYEWSEPTLSLGYFQRIAELEADPRFAATPLVRRTTGGGAIWHEHEITYAVILPRTHPQGQRASDLYRTVHDAIRLVLSEVGGEPVRRGEATIAQNQPEVPKRSGTRPFLCFTDRDPEDIVIGDVKVVGSAQRRKPGAILQHGSILMGRAARIPELPGLAEMTGFQADASHWIPRLQGSILAALSLDPTPTELDAGSRARSVELEHATYRDPAWTAKR